MIAAIKRTLAGWLEELQFFAVLVFFILAIAMAKPDEDAEEEGAE